MSSFDVFAYLQECNHSFDALGSESSNLSCGKQEDDDNNYESVDLDESACQLDAEGYAVWRTIRRC